MDATRGRPGSRGSSWDNAERLAMAIAAGGRLPEIASPVLLEDGEVLHASDDVNAWRFQGMDVPYVGHRGFAVGGMFTFGLTAAAIAAANRRARAEAERLAAPQWRPLGVVEVVATRHRLRVLHNGPWTSVWYESIRQIRPSLEQDRLELLFEDAPPYLLVGPGVLTWRSCSRQRWLCRSEPTLWRRGSRQHESRGPARQRVIEGVSRNGGVAVA